MWEHTPTSGNIIISIILIQIGNVYHFRPPPSPLKLSALHSWSFHYIRPRLLLVLIIYL